MPAEQQKLHSRRTAALISSVTMAPKASRRSDSSMAHSHSSTLPVTVISDPLVTKHAKQNSHWV